MFRLRPSHPADYLIGDGLGGCRSWFDSCRLEIGAGKMKELCLQQHSVCVHDCKGRICIMVVRMAHVISVYNLYVYMCKLKADF